jgi:ATP-dependent RNA helicase DeaD
VNGFADVGLHAALVRALDRAGIEEPTALQRAAIPVLRRGGNAVLHGSPGAGLTLTWGLPLLDGLATSDTPLADAVAALVVVATDARASAVASTLAQLAGEADADAGFRDLRIRALVRGWNDAAAAHVLIASLGAVVHALPSSQLKLDAVRVVVLENVPALLGVEGEAALETLLVTVPREAQRIAVTGEPTRAVLHLIATHVRRALQFPTNRAAAEESAVTTGSVSYLVVPEAAKADALARLLGRPRNEAPVITARTAQRADAFAHALELRGYAVVRSGAGPADAIIRHGVRPPAGARIACDVPFDAEGLRALDAEDGLVLIQPSEIPHLRAIARQAGRELHAVGRERSGRDALAAFRAQVRKAMEDEDIELHLAALEPLFADHAPEEVAAALSALLRRRAPAPPTERPAPRAASPYVRIFVSAGQRDGIRAGDLVGAITAEAQIPGDRIGRIEIRDTFSVIEIDADTAQKVIRALNGTTYRGRSLRVDYDRRPAAGSPGPRRKPHRPPT